MSLDQNLFTLLFTPNKDHPNVTDLVDPSGTVHYHKRRVAGQEYKIEVFDPLSESLLITASAPSASSKAKTLELHNPTSVIELKYTGTISFKWGFKWEEHEFEWKREQCFLIRKPDPPVLVAVTKEPSRQVRTAQVQILDYNLHRFDIDDRKGLEIVLLTALMTFHDAKEASVLGDSLSSPVSEHPPASPLSLSRKVSAIMAADAIPPPTPPKPAPKTGLERITEMQALKGEDYNEITIEEEGSVEEYAQYCNTLLSDDAMLFISVKSSAAEFVPKVLHIVEETKRIRYRAGLDDDELHQYVLYDLEKKKERKRINLNDDAEQKNKYTPPSSLLVHLSKIDMPELQPKSTLTSQPSKPSKPSKGKEPMTVADFSKPQSSKAKSSKKKDDKKASPSRSTPTPPPASPGASQQSKPHKNKLTRPPRDSSPKGRPSPSPFPPHPPYPPQHHPPQPSGLFNSHPIPPTQTSGPLSVTFHSPTPNYQGAPPSGFPVPATDGHSNSSGRKKIETAAMSLYNSLMPHTPGPPPSGSGSGSPYHQGAHPNAYAPYPGGPPPPPPGPPPASGSGMGQKATAVAQNVVSGLFDIVKNANSHRR